MFIWESPNFSIFEEWGLKLQNSLFAHWFLCLPLLVSLTLPFLTKVQLIYNVMLVSGIKKKWFSYSFPLYLIMGASQVALMVKNLPAKARDTWTSPDSQYWNQTDFILCSQRRRSYTQSAKTRLGADCGSDHELPIAKFRLKLKKVGKTTGPFRYDLNKTPYNYTVEVTNKFKGLDLIDSAWRTIDGGLWHCKMGGDQNHPQEEMQKGKMVVWGGLTNICEKKRSERQNFSVWQNSLQIKKINK